jgi:uncharacterized membrane protein YgcG
MRNCQRSFKITLFVVLTLSLNLFLILLVSPALAQYFTILRFHSDITVRQDSSFTVKETIDLKFDRPRHGIYREIPFKYVNELGGVTRTPIKVLSVTNESGKTWKHQVNREGAVIHIRIGDPKRYVNGTQTYVITYRVENALLFLNDHDELYWNVTGNAWKAPIREASADVFLSIKKKSEKLWQGCYTGVYGSSESECDAESYENGGKFQTRRKLRTGEGFTIAFGWDKGLVSPPSSWRRFLWTLDLKENWVFLFPPLILVYMVFRWKRKGRDPKVKESIAVQYEPPKFENRPLTPAEVGTLLDEKLDPRDITSTIVGLGVKGYLRIEEVKKEGWLSDSTDYYLKKIKDLDPEISPFEIELLRSLFPASLPGVLVSALKNKFYLHLDVLKKTLYGELVRKKYFTSNPERVRHSYAGVGFLVMVIGCLVFLFLVRDSVGKGIVAGILSGLPVIAFARFMPAKTRAGASAYMDILGFQEFMNRAEKDRLERIGDKDLFSKFLPYALALNVADNWAKAFEGIYQNPPDWYASPGGFRTFSPYGFTHSISSATSDLSSAMFSAPRGSNGNGGGGGGSGGGGSSGGGFGGGGGGSW